MPVIRPQFTFSIRFFLFVMATAVTAPLVILLAYSWFTEIALADEPLGLALAAAWPSIAFKSAVLLAAILLVAVLARVLGERIEAPIRALVRATAAVARGDLTTRVAPEGPAELAQLAAQFNAMVDARQKADERLHYQAHLLDQVHDAIIATDGEQRITTWNRAAEAMYGWTAVEAVGQQIDTILPTESEVEASAGQAGGTDGRGPRRVRARQYRKTGELILIEGTRIALREADGRAVGYVSVNRDVTEYQRAEENLRQRTAHAEALLHSAARLNARLNLDTVVRAVALETATALNVPLVFVFLYDENIRSFRLAASAGLGESALQRLKTRPYLDLEAGEVFPGQSRNWIPLATWSDAGSGDVPALTSALSVAIRRKEELVGLICAATTNGARPFSGEECELLGGLADQAALAITNARLFEQVRVGRQRLQSLSARLVQVQETERHEIARELHDEIGQALTGLSLVLEMTARAPAHTQRTNLAEAQGIVNQLMKQVRDISLNLRPAMLDDLGLVPALTWHARRYAAQTGIEVDMKLMDLEGKRFPPAVETAAYRMVQEALTNVARYARVNRVQVRVWSEEQWVELLIEDEGVGFDAEAVLSSNQSSGLIGMRERAMLLGGQFVLESAPGEGTRINARLPFNGVIERRAKERVA